MYTFVSLCLVVQSWMNVCVVMFGRPVVCETVAPTTMPNEAPFACCEISPFSFSALRLKMPLYSHPKWKNKKQKNKNNRGIAQCVNGRCNVAYKCMQLVLSIAFAHSRSRQWFEKVRLQFLDLRRFWKMVGMKISTSTHQLLHASISTSTLQPWLPSAALW